MRTPLSILISDHQLLERVIQAGSCPYLMEARLVSRMLATNGSTLKASRQRCQLKRWYVLKISPNPAEFVTLNSVTSE